MNWKDLTLSDIECLVRALEQANTHPDIVRAVIDRVQAEPMVHGRVTIDSLFQLLQQTNGSTTLPDGIAALLSEVELPERLANKQLTSLNPQRLAAREIMGTNFFGVEEAIQHFGVAPTLEQLAALAEIPFSVQTLQECKDSHILVAVFPLSILDIRAKVPRAFYSHEAAWYNTGAFATNKGEVGWHLVRKTIVPNSTWKTWDEQWALLGNEEETPTAQVMVYTIIGHFLATAMLTGEAGERLFYNSYVSTSSVVANGNHVRLGGFDLAGLGIFNDQDNHHAGNLAIASARKRTITE